MLKSKNTSKIKVAPKTKNVLKAKKAAKIKIELKPRKKLAPKVIRLRKVIKIEDVLPAAKDDRLFMAVAFFALFLISAFVILFRANSASSSNSNLSIDGSYKSLNCSHDPLVTLPNCD